MSRTPAPLRAVLTGDLVKSRHLSDESLNSARSALLLAAEDVGTWQPHLLGSRPEFFRGDSWQVLLLRPELCLRAAIFSRARLRGANPEWDTRIAIGIGAVTHVDAARTSLSGGEAFIISGQALDHMATNDHLVLASAGEGDWDGLATLAEICSVIVDDWSQKQAQLAALALAPTSPTQLEMAHNLRITQQAVSKMLSAAKLPTVLQAISYFERLEFRRSGPKPQPI